MRIKIFSLTLVLSIAAGCGKTTQDQEYEKKEISSVLDSFHLAAARADFDGYFRYMADDAVFIGTDATELWKKKEFMVWAKPYFDRGKAWNFKPIDRHIYFGGSGTAAWVDELLDTQMKICRGSGALVRQEEGWRIKHYVLSMTVPNILADTVVRLKTSIEDSIIAVYSGK